MQHLLSRLSVNGCPHHSIIPSGTSLLLKKPIQDSFNVEAFPMARAACTVHRAGELAVLLAAQASSDRWRLHFPREILQYVTTLLKDCQLFSTVTVPGSNTFHSLALL